MGGMRIEILKNFETCDVCGCKSKVVKHFWGIGGGGESLLCSGEEKYPEEHCILYDKLELFEQEHPKSYKEELKKEIKELRKKFRSIPPKEK